MITPIDSKLREILRRSSTPMPASLLAQRIGRLQGTVVNALKRMPDAYIADWKPNERSRDVPQWAVVIPPPNAPRPPMKKAVKP